MHASIARRARCLLLVLGTAHSVLHGQQPELSGPRFEVASVRQHRAEECQGRWDFTASHGKVIALNAPLRRIISRAFELTDDRVSGPGWIDSQCYDIQAKAPRQASDRNLMPMLQTLLIERFHLVGSHDSAEKPVFALVVDKDGPKIPAYDDPVFATPAIDEGKILFMVRHMPDLCERLGRVAGRPVIDKTGLHGDYRIVLLYPPFTSSASDPSDPSFDIFAAVRSQLGLRLEAQRASVDILKILSIDKAPTRN